MEAAELFPVVSMVCVCLHLWLHKLIMTSYLYKLNNYSCINDLLSIITFLVSLCDQRTLWVSL